MGPVPRQDARTLGRGPGGRGARRAPETAIGGFLCSVRYAGAGMTGAKSEATDTPVRLEKPAASSKGPPKEREKEPTHCETCGKRLGVWFSLAEKAYCSPCFHRQFWTPFQSVPDKTP